MHHTSLSPRNDGLRRRARTLLLAGLGLGASLAASTTASAQVSCPAEDAAGQTSIYGGSWGRDTSAAPGSVLACRSISAAKLWADSTKTPSSFVSRVARAISVRFVTTDAGNKKVPATALVLVPSAVPNSNANTAPLIAVGTGTAGVSDACAPSRTVRRGTSLVANSVDYYLGKGLTVVVVDFLGLGVDLGTVDGDDHPYLEGPSAGNVMLDALRAARKVPGAKFGDPSGLIPETWPVAVEGYSQGGAAAIWAAVRGPSYAQGLPLKAAVVGAAPVDLEKTLDSIDNSLFRSLFGYALHGIENATDPSTRLVNLKSYLTDAGKDLLERTRTTCAVENGTQTALDVIFGAYNLKDLVKDVDQFKQLPAVQAFFKKNSLIIRGAVQMHATKPSTGVFSYHGMLDGVVPYDPHHDLLVKGWSATVGGAILTGEAALPRAAYAFQPAIAGSHSTTSSLERNDSRSDQRYAPYEWVWDGLFNAARTWPDLTP
jgi:pimeloyl-ACP methyl ester carboxylesterase